MNNDAPQETVSMEPEIPAAWNQPRPVPRPHSVAISTRVWILLIGLGLILLGLALMFALHSVGGLFLLSAGVFWLGVALAGVWLYTLPMMIAHEKKHPQFIGIMLVNLLLGWSVLGWVAALIWANYVEKK